MSIQVQSLTHVYPGRIVAIKDITLKINAGELLAIMGENGAGKTTLVKHFNGLLRPSRGKILIDGVNIRRIHPAKLSLRVGMVFQNPDHQIFAKNVYEEIAFGLKRFKLYKFQMKKRIDEVAAETGAAGLLELSPYALSLGERKRVALTCILAWNPEVVVLDEPTIGQDALLKNGLKVLIQELHSEGKTVVMISHDVEFVAELRPRIVLMRQGGIVADGPAEEILTDPTLVQSSSLILPQITQLVAAFSGERSKTLEVDAAVSLIRGRKDGSQ